MTYRNSFIAGAGLLLMLVATASPAHGQFNRKWLSAGALHNWYSEIGAEIESGGFVGSQQDGMRWPGVYPYTDVQAWKGLWIGARDVVDDQGNQYPVRVVHVGPRVTGSGEFFPVAFEMVSRYAPPPVYVDGILSEGLAPMANDRVDPDIPADHLIYNRVNTLLGLTMERTILQFSQPFHDDYHVIEYVLTNTGNTDDDDEIELPGQTLEDVVAFLQWRLAPTKEPRYVIGNASGWGINTMLDIWGDGVDDDFPGGAPVRAHYAWHGYFPNKDVSYNNIGGPILPEAVPAVQVAADDTLGRLAAYQFAGIATLHADASAGDPTDAPDQPSTTAWIESDAPFQSNNDALNPVKMEAEYRIMTRGHQAPSHAYTIEPSGEAGWIETTADPSLGTPGGFSAASGYGPYTLAPGESVRFVVAEAVSGLSREAANEIGHLYKEANANDAAPLTYTVDGQSRSLTKNEWVFTGRDSLYQTFLRAVANYESGYGIPRGPQPPAAFEVASGGDRIALSWTYPAGEPLPDHFEIYRAEGEYDSTYTMIAEVGAGETSYDDRTPQRGIDYYYYLQAVSSGADNDGTGMTPAGVPLRSSRYYTQTYIPARLKRQPGERMADIRVVPNPFNISSSSSVRWPDQVDKLGFLNVPGQCQIDIYTELGELVDTIHHDDGSGDAFWDHTTSSRQVVVSGIYLAVITVTADIYDEESGELVFRRGERALRKISIIR